VTAEGEVVHADATEHPDLFWGLRGGGGNFGIVTSFQYRLHPVGPAVLAGPIYFDLDDAPAVLRSYREFIVAAPDELTTIVNLRRAPAAPFLPPALHGRAVVAILSCYAGPIHDGERVLAPLRRARRPLLDLIVPRPYVEHLAMFDAAVPHGLHYDWKALQLASLGDDVIDVIAEHPRRAASARSYTVIFQLGGAVARVDDDATAYSQRRAGHAVNINAVWQPADQDADRHITWARDFFHALEPFQVGAYVNFLGDEGHGRVRRAYGAATYARLAALKRRYDPMNFFRLNQNIPPAPPPARPG
jgi:FAD/FMN-containing dehydrogenase